MSLPLKIVGSALGLVIFSGLGMVPANAATNAEPAHGRVASVSTYSTMASGEMSRILSTPLSASDRAFLDKIVSVGEFFHFNSQGLLTVELSDSQLMAKGFSTSEVSRTRAMLATSAQRSGSDISDQGRPRGYAGKRIFYLSHSALVGGVASALYAASQVSPAALAAAWAAFTSTFSGPIGVGTAILGGAFFADLAVKIVGAVAQNKGIGFYAKWGVPPLETVIE